MDITSKVMELLGIEEPVEEDEDAEGKTAAENPAAPVESPEPKAEPVPPAAQ